MNNASLQRKVFLWLLLLVTLAFAAVLLPFFGGVFWATILALLFAPFHRRLLARMPGRPNLAALLTLLLCLLIVILPVTLIVASVINEATALYQNIRSGQLNVATYFEQLTALLPAWLNDWLHRLGLGTLAELRQKLAASAAQASQFAATQAVAIGQNTLRFLVGFGVMLYLLFFLLRDGRALSQRIRQALPLGERHKQLLAQKFITVIRATVKGNIVVAAVQGLLGALAFWALGIQGAMLWGVLMGFLSLLPAVGASLIWGPVALYFLATGALWQGLGLAAFGVLVIGLVDNVLRPILVGKDTKMPDYVVLISTLGGMSLFGLNGFVIGPLIAALFMSAWDLFTQRDEAEAERDDGRETATAAAPKRAAGPDRAAGAEAPARSRRRR